MLIVLGLAGVPVNATTRAAKGKETECAEHCGKLPWWQSTALDCACLVHMGFSHMIQSQFGDALSAGVKGLCFPGMYEPVIKRAYEP